MGATPGAKSAISIITLLVYRSDETRENEWIGRKVISVGEVKRSDNRRYSSQMNYVDKYNNPIDSMYIVCNVQYPPAWTSAW